MGEMEDLLVVKKVGRPNLQADSASSTAVKEDPSSSSSVVMSDLSSMKIKKVKKLKITIDGEVKHGDQEKGSSVEDEEDESERAVLLATGWLEFFRFNAHCSFECFCS